MTKTTLFATDLDGTFIGNDEAMFSLWKSLEEQGFVVGFSTGRHLKSIQGFYAEKQATRQADLCVCMVGTDIHYREGKEYHLDTGWHDIIGHAWDKGKVSEIVDSIPEARPQDPQWQSPFKSSYYLEENAEARLSEIHERLATAGLQAKVVYSVGKFLDLLPIRSGKGEAVKYAATKVGATPENVITCGDTGNDLDMMREELGFRSIIVGNAEAELKQFSGPRVYHAKAAFAAGIREGLESFGLL